MQHRYNILNIGCISIAGIYSSSHYGGEYIKRQFQPLCASKGIHLQHSVPYTPQKNGLDKKKNWSLKEMTTCLLEARDILPYIWDEVVNCASYSYNRVPHKLVVGVTPFEALMGHKPNISHMMVFYSKYQDKIPSNKRKVF